MRKYIPYISVFLFIALVSGVLMMKDTAFAGFTPNTDAYNPSPYKYSLTITPQDTSGKGFKSLEAFLHFITQNPKEALSFSRHLAHAIETETFHTYGFILTLTMNKKGTLCFTFYANKKAHDAPNGERILVNQPYTPHHPFQSYLMNPEKVLLQSAHALSLQSRSGNYLVIPRQGYVSLYDFCKKAPEAEISDFWHHVSMLKNTLDQRKISYGIAAHGGSHGYQTVPHFHLRFEVCRTNNKR